MAAAASLGLAPQTLAKWRHLGIGPRYQKHGSRVFYPETEMNIYKKESLRSSTSDPGTEDPDAQNEPEASSGNGGEERVKVVEASRPADRRRRPAVVKN